MEDNQRFKIMRLAGSTFRQEMLSTHPSSFYKGYLHGLAYHDCIRIGFEYSTFCMYWRFLTKQIDLEGGDHSEWQDQA